MTTKDYVVLLVDDEPDILEFLGYNLRKEGYQVFTATNGKEAIDIAIKETPHLIILDVMMPEMDGMEACRQIREIPQLKNTLIAFFTARNEDYSQIAGFEAGADDYISKPIRPRILLSRIKAILRRVTSTGEQEANEPETFGELIIDREKYLVLKNGEKISLPKKEFEVLFLLSSSPGRVFSREYILEKIWGEDVTVGDRTINVRVSKLREKIGEKYIKTIKGVGYKFEF